jgi:anti-sigma regulatory factor (Ser/Thr protein kinase)
LSELGLDELLDQLLTRIRDILDVDTVAILLIDEEGDSMVARAGKGLEEEVEQGIRIPIGKGFAGRIADGRVPIFIADVDHADILNPVLRRKGVRSLLGVPMIAEGALIGVLHVGSLRPRIFAPEDVAALQVAAGRAAPAIERARLYAALEREQGATLALQRSLLPDRLPSVVGVSVAARYSPARDEVGGDWYDVVELAKGRMGFAIGDVVGHGIRAAALMGQLRIAMRAYSLEGHGPGTVLELLDRLLHAIRERGMATATYAIFDSETSTLRFASAGHPPPVAVLGARSRLLEPPSAPPLGTLPYASYPEIDVVLEPDELVLLYTDGLVERRGEPLARGIERLLAAARGAASAEHLCEIAGGLVPAGGADDDIALVALQHSPVPAELRLQFPAEPPVLAHLRQTLRRWLHDRGADREEVMQMTLACSEASANAIEHAYSPAPASFEVEAREEDGVVTLVVRDAGHWRAPRGENRGRGLVIIDSAMDDVAVRPTEGGTEVVMRRRLRRAA